MVGSLTGSSFGALFGFGNAGKLRDCIASVFVRSHSDLENILAPLMYKFSISAPSLLLVSCFRAILHLVPVLLTDMICLGVSALL